MKTLNSPFKVMVHKQCGHHWFGGELLEICSKTKANECDLFREQEFSVVIY